MENSMSGPSTLVEASRVQGTTVYNPLGEKLGAVDDIMIDKRTGVAAYAILSFGGFLGLGADLFPVPWSKLKYVPSLGGFVVDIEAKALKEAPQYTTASPPLWGDISYEERLHNHYGVPPYWDGNPV